MVKSQNQRISRACLLLGLLTQLTACVDGDGDSAGGATTDPTQNNVRQYEELRLSLEQKREQVLPASPVDATTAAGPWLVWLDVNQGFSAILHARRYPGEQEVVSAVPIGDEQTPPNFAISESLAMTARTSGTDAIYTVLRLDTGTVLDELKLTMPDAAKYDAYAVFGEEAYVVVEAQDLAVYAWTPGSTTATAIGTIGATGATLGAWAGFLVTEDTEGVRRLIAIGSGGTYSIDLATMQATRIPLPVMPIEGGINEHGIAARDGEEIWWFGWNATEVRAIHDELAASTYLLNSTYSHAHLPGSGTASQDITIDGTTIFYRSNSGVYAYDTGAMTVTPILLDDLDYAGTGVLVTYTGLGFGDGGLFVTGLESMSGSIGSDGPTYRVAL